jgi:hypothetical protein
MRVFYNFLETCKLQFNNDKIKSVFLKNKSPIFDLYDIPIEDKYIYISENTILRELKVLRKNFKISFDRHSRNKFIDNINTPTMHSTMDILKNESSFKFSFYSPDKKKLSKKLFKLHSPIQPIFKSKIKKMSEISCSHKRSKSCQQIKEDYENTTSQQIISFKSNDKALTDNETNKSKKYKYLIEKFKNNLEDKNQILLYFHESLLEIQKKKIIAKRSLKKNHYKKDSLDLIDNYNLSLDRRRKKIELYIKSKNIQMNSKPKLDYFFEDTKRMIEEFNFKYKKSGILETELIDENLLNINRNKKSNYLQKNRSLYENIYYNLERQVDSRYPGLFYFNIPRMLRSFTTFDRRELYEVFSQFKILMKICVAINKDLKISKKGIDFNTFWKCVPQLSVEKANLAKKIYKVINESENNQMSMVEFLKGMSIIKSPDISDKIDMFFKIIDSDGNGMLSFEEVYEISLMSLQRTVTSNETADLQVIKDLADYFATIIFKMVDINVDEEIPLPKVREKIIEGGEEAEFLEMFCCADGFKRIDHLKFFK